MPRKSLLLIASAFFMAAVVQAGIVPELLNDKTAKEYKELQAKPPEQSKTRLADIARIQRKFADWQNRVADEREAARDDFSRRKDRDPKAVERMVEEFRSVIKGEAVDDLLKELKPSNEKGKWENTLADFWECYRGAATCRA